ncbi:hypothetical protein M0813_13908 [Anaeramoeba flamelloides]|uniref:Uncharacterized protein n=1 Tax=Anaeramoeba flamelloides TaxID=1746091 RepID=A0ABQ8Z746_9EUKA|nr:hypothetical protein M0813_13908 [Anaeramoeba flamelloides]
MDKKSIKKNLSDQNQVIMFLNTINNSEVTENNSTSCNTSKSCHSTSESSVIGFDLFETIIKEEKKTQKGKNKITQFKKIRVTMIFFILPLIDTLTDWIFCIAFAKAKGCVPLLIRRRKLLIALSFASTIVGSITFYFKTGGFIKNLFELKNLEQAVLIEINNNHKDRDNFFRKRRLNFICKFFFENLIQAIITIYLLYKLRQNVNSLVGIKLFISWMNIFIKGQKIIFILIFTALYFVCLLIFGLISLLTIFKFKIYIKWVRRHFEKMSKRIAKLDNKKFIQRSKGGCFRLIFSIFIYLLPFLILLFGFVLLLFNNGPSYYESEIKFGNIHINGTIISNFTENDHFVYSWNNFQSLNFLPTKENNMFYHQTCLDLKKQNNCIYHSHLQQEYCFPVIKITGSESLPYLQGDCNTRIDNSQRGFYPTKTFTGSDKTNNIFYYNIAMNKKIYLWSYTLKKPIYCPRF